MLVHIESFSKKQTVCYKLFKKRVIWQRVQWAISSTWRHPPINSKKSWQDPQSHSHNQIKSAKEAEWIYIQILSYLNLQNLAAQPTPNYSFVEPDLNLYFIKVWDNKYICYYKPLICGDFLYNMQYKYIPSIRIGIER